MSDCQQSDSIKCCLSKNRSEVLVLFLPQIRGMKPNQLAHDAYRCVYLDQKSESLIHACEENKPMVWKTRNKRKRMGGLCCWNRLHGERQNFWRDVDLFCLNNVLKYARLKTSGVPNPSPSGDPYALGLLAPRTAQLVIQLLLTNLTQHNIRRWMDVVMYVKSYNGIAVMSFKLRRIICTCICTADSIPLVAMSSASPIWDAEPEWSWCLVVSMSVMMSCPSFPRLDWKRLVLLSWRSDSRFRLVCS